MDKKIHTLGATGLRVVNGEIAGRTRCGVGGIVVWCNARRQLLTQRNYLLPLVKLGRFQYGKTFMEARHQPVEEPTCKQCLRAR